MLKKLTAFAESLVKKSSEEQLLAIDIGSSSIKIAEINLLAEKPVLEALSVLPIPGGVFNNNEISDTQEVANLIKALISKVDSKATKASFCLPGPASFVKRISTAHASLKEFDQTISFEAANYIPDDLSAVHFDYQVLNHDEEKKLMDVLLVAVKNEIVHGFLQSIRMADLHPVIAEIDYFALSNIFEKSYPEVAQEKTVALIEIGARYARVCIMEAGALVFSGDIAIGSKLYNEVLKETLGLGPADAEKAKAGIPVEAEGVDQEAIKSALESGTEQLVSELYRQMKFFIGAAELSKELDEIYISGGALQVPGILESLATKMGKPCKLLDPVLNIELGSGVSQELLDSQKHRFAICLGLAYRRLADKKHAID